MTLTQITEKGIKDGEIVNADINASAAIAKSKLASLDIVNGDINASAAIAKSKIETFVSNNADNRVITGSGTENTLNGESQLLFDGNLTIKAADGGNRYYFGGSDVNHAELSLYDNTDSQKVRLYAGGASFFNGGSLGIGTTAPSEKLTIGDGDLKFFHSNAANAHRTTFIEFGNSSNRITSEMNYGSDNSSNYTAGLKFTTKNFNGSSFVTVDALNIQANGKVGIGTTSPAQLFHVNGQAKVNSLGIGQDAGSTTLAITGNMAINTTGNTAYSKFNIAGSGSTTGSAFTINNYGDAEGDYYHFGVNSTQNASGNTSKTNTAKRSSAVTLDGRMGRVIISTSQTSTSTIDEHFTFDRSGNFSLSGNIVPVNGKGIDFSAAPNASGMSSEVFDRYEEGTWTPTWVGSSGTGTFSYDTQYGKYTRIGQHVFYTWVLIANGHSGSTNGAIRVAGLPYAVDSNMSPNAGTVFPIIGWNDSFDNCLVTQLNSSEEIEFYKQVQSSGANYSSVMASSMNLGSLYAKGGGHYIS